MEKLINKLKTLPDFLIPIGVAGLKYINNNTYANTDEIKILHRPWVAPLNWSIMLYRPPENKWLTMFEEITGKQLPEFYRDFLNHFNGGFIHELSLYGLTPSYFSNGSIDRTVLQCLNLATANQSWIWEYEVDDKLFHFGGRRYSFSEIAGYFYDYESKEIICVRKNGEIISSWKKFGDFLFDEIYTVEKMMLEKVPADIQLKTD